MTGGGALTEVGPTLTLHDIADLAGVQRAVVSTWRRRTRVRGQHMPFPGAVPGTGPVERFRRDEVVDWLARTGRGNNAEHRLDAPALSPPIGASLEDLVTLLCLAAEADHDLADLTTAERVRLAERSDPGDEFLLTEVRELGAAGELLQFVDDLVEASFGLSEALARLEAGPAGRTLRRRELTVEGIELVRAVVQAGTLHLDPDGVPVAISGCPPSLGLAIATGARHLVIDGSAPAERALRRRALLHDLEVAPAAGGPLLRVRSVLRLADELALSRVDDLLLELGPRDLAVVVGPAGILCERLSGDAERDRAGMLRPGPLRVALRLRRGMWREAHRQALGLWVCAGSRTTDRLMVADLGAVPPAGLSVPDVAADVSGALAGDGGRAFRYLRIAELPAIMTGSPIVPLGARAPRLRASSSDHLDRVQAAALITAEPQPPLDVLVTATPGGVLLRQRSLGELRDAGAVVVHRGCRVDPGHAQPGGSVPVLSGDGPVADVALDPFDAERLYRRARRTEPGDVVFTPGQPPRAVVDELGGALVASPSRILRLGTGVGAGPYTIAAIINHQSPTTEWQTWGIPLFDPDAAVSLEAALVEAAAYGVELQRRQGVLRDLITAMVDGVAAGAVSVASNSKNQEGR